MKNIWNKRQIFLFFSFFIFSLFLIWIRFFFCFYKHTHIYNTRMLNQKVLTCWYSCCCCRFGKSMRKKKKCAKSLAHFLLWKNKIKIIFHQRRKKTKYRIELMLLLLCKFFFSCYLLNLFGFVLFIWNHNWLEIILRFCSSSLLDLKALFLWWWIFFCSLQRLSGAQIVRLNSRAKISLNVYFFFQTKFIS